MSDRYFVDTNVLVYFHDAAFPQKQGRAREWLSLLWRAQCGRISVQVLNEWYHTVTRKLCPGIAPETARKSVRNLFAWRPHPLNTALVESAYPIEARYGFSYWDALIVSAARATGCRYLLTEDLQDGQELDGLTVINPFRHEPPAGWDPSIPETTCRAGDRAP